MIVLVLAAGLLSVAALLPVGIIAVQILAAARARGALGNALPDRPRLAVLMPAHDEAGIILDALHPVRAQLDAGDRLLVVADNCSDDTAAVAARAGAQVIERNDATARGKIHALESGLRALQADPPEVVVVVDADCRVEPGCIDRVARECAASGRPVQGLYLMQAPPDAPVTTRIAAFAWIVKNWIRPLGMKHLGLPCQLMGSATAFPWRLTHHLYATDGMIAEDYKAGIGMALEGRAALFCPEALARSEFPRDEDALRSQRTRWEHGHLHLILIEVPVLVLHALRRGDWGLLALAADLAVPPLALVTLVTGAAIAVGAAAAPQSAWPFVLAIGGATVLVISVAIAWRGWGRGTISAGELALSPLYALGKLPIYARYLFNRQRHWVKTPRG